MFKRIIVSLTLSCFILCIQGCYSKKIVLHKELDEHPEYYISAVTTHDGEVFEFEHGAVFIHDKIEGCLKGGIIKQIPLSHVQKIFARKFDYAKTGGAVLGYVVLTAVLLYVELWFIFRTADF